MYTGSRFFEAQGDLARDSRQFSQAVKDDQEGLRTGS